MNKPCEETLFDYVSKKHPHLVSTIKIHDNKLVELLEEKDEEGYLYPESQNLLEGFYEMDEVVFEFDIFEMQDCLKESGLIKFYENTTIETSNAPFPTEEPVPTVSAESGYIATKENEAALAAL